MSFVNVASCLGLRARSEPKRIALILPPHGVGARRFTYEHLHRESDALAHGLVSIGIGRGVRTALMVRPGLEFFALVFAIAKVGAVPVVADPGMGAASLKACLAEAEPRAFIGVPLAHAARAALGWGRDTIDTLVTVGGPALFGGHRLGQVRERGGDEPYPIAETQADEVAGILFTSGSTGPPKGVVYTHGNFAAQVEALRAISSIHPGEIDLATFPLFALFDPALGMTTVIPDMDPSRPAKVDPRKIIGPILAHGVTTMFASPAVLTRVARYGHANRTKLPTLKRVISAGAPVPDDVIAQFMGMLEDDAQLFTPYGATEALPATSITSTELLSPELRSQTRRGAGVCVGRPVSEMRISVIAIDDGPIATWAEAKPLVDGEIGEIVVKGPVVTGSYFNAAAANAQSKIREGSEILHRMGDLGYRDASGRLWFCGRKAHRVVTGRETLFSVPCEGVFNAHPEVFRTALVGVPSRGAVVAVLCVELERTARRSQHPRITRELLLLGQSQAQTRGITTVLFHRGFPVDARHNSKIVREKLAVWAEMKLR